MRDEIDEIEELLGKKKLELEAFTQSLVEWMESASLMSFKLESGDGLYIQDKPYSQVMDKTAWLAWIKETGQEDLLSVHYQTMNSLVASRLRDGKDLPPGIKAFIKSSIMRRRPQ